MNTNFTVFGLTRPGIEPVSTASVADALSTRPLIGYSTYCKRFRFFAEYWLLFCEVEKYTRLALPFAFLWMTGW